MLSEVILCAWIFRHKHTDDTDYTGSLGRCDEVVLGQVIGFVTMTVAALIAHTFAPAISPLAMSQIENVIHCFFLQRVDWRRAHLSSQLQSVWMVVDYKYLRCTFDYRRVSGHQTDRAGTVNANALSK